MSSLAVDVAFHRYRAECLDRITDDEVAIETNTTARLDRPNDLERAEEIDLVVTLDTRGRLERRLARNHRGTVFEVVGRHLGGGLLRHMIRSLLRMAAWTLDRCQDEGFAWFHLLG